VHARLDLKAHLFDKSITIRGKNWDINELDMIALNYPILVLNSTQVNNFVLRSLRVSSLFWGIVTNDLDSSEFILLQILQDLVQLMDQGGVSSKTLDILIGNNHSTNSLGQVNK